MPGYVETRGPPRQHVPDPAINGRPRITLQALKESGRFCEARATRAVSAEFRKPGQSRSVLIGIADGDPINRENLLYLIDGDRPRVGACTRDLRSCLTRAADAEPSHLAQGITNKNAQVHDG